MTTILKVNINDLSTQFIRELRNKLGKNAQIEIRVEEQKYPEGLLSDTQFWQIIDLLDWSKKDYKAILAPAVAALAKMDRANIYLFKDKMSEKLYALDTKAHAKAYLEKEEDSYLSADYFLYVRCAVIAEGKSYYEKVVKKPSEMPSDIDFEPLLSLADEAYTLKTGKEFNYPPLFNYETHQNQEGWATPQYKKKTSPLLQATRFYFFS
jgi:hypothetical protein